MKRNRSPASIARSNKQWVGSLMILQVAKRIANIRFDNGRFLKWSERLRTEKRTDQKKEEYHGRKIKRDSGCRLTGADRRRNLQHVASDRADRACGKAGTIYFRILPQCRKAASTSDQPVRDRPGAGKSENRLSSDRKKYRYRGIQHL